MTTANVCVSEHLVVGADGKLRLAPWSVPRLVADEIAHSGADTTKPPPKSLSGSVSAAAIAPAAAPAAAGGANVNNLLAANACTASHGVKNKIVGPSFTEIAAKHKGKADVEAYLAGKIKSGGSGVYGPVPMPPQPQISDADAKTIAAWIAGGPK